MNYTNQQSLSSFIQHKSRFFFTLFASYKSLWNISHSTFQMIKQEVTYIPENMVQCAVPYKSLCCESICQEHKCKFLSNDLPLTFVFWLFWRTMLILNGNSQELNYGWVILRKEAPCHLPSTLSQVPNPYVTWLHGLGWMCSREGQRGLRHLEQ